MQKTQLPPGEQALQSKHEWQMQMHQARYGKLGEPQSKQHKKLLAADIKLLEDDGYIKAGKP